MATPMSNWVIPGKLMQGAYPGDKDLQLHKDKLDAILDSGVTTFVSLMEENETKKFRPYKDYVKEKRPHTKFLNIPVPDHGITTDEKILQLAKYVADMIKTSDEVFYVHCWGGHGRSGTLVAIILTQLGYSVEDALFLVRKKHMERLYNGNVLSPQTKRQVNQVRRLYYQPLSTTMDCEM